MITARQSETLIEMTKILLEEKKRKSTVSIQEELKAKVYSIFTKFNRVL